MRASPPGLRSDESFPQSLVLAPALAGLCVVFLRANSNAMVARFRPRLANGVLVAAAIPVCVLQLARVTPFLYFNF